MKPGICFPFSEAPRGVPTHPALAVYEAEHTEGHPCCALCRRGPANVSAGSAPYWKSLQAQFTSHLRNDFILCFLLQELWKVMIEALIPYVPNCWEKRRVDRLCGEHSGSSGQWTLAAAVNPGTTCLIRTFPCIPWRRSMCGNGKTVAWEVRVCSAIEVLHVLGSLDAIWEQLPTPTSWCCTMYNVCPKDTVIVLYK